LELPVRWLLVAILAYVAVVAEMLLFRPGVLAVHLDDHWARPDLLLVLGVFLALNLELHETFVVGWCFGLASDLVAVAGRLGVGALLLAVALSLVGLFRKGLFGGRVLGHFLLCLGVCFAVHWAWYVASRYLEAAPLWVGRSAEEAALDALYTALLAPYVFWGMSRLRRPLGLTTAAIPE
jgi:cell shape-determining protein MreD